MKKSQIQQKIKFGIFIPRRITKRPTQPDAVISDLFPVRSNNLWTTYFECLNVPGLITGNNDSSIKSEIIVNFYNDKGIILGNVASEIGKFGRQTIKLDRNFFPNIENASTFSVFHTQFDRDPNLETSFLAERGYVGLQRNDMDFRGYVHGNLDAIAWSKGEQELLGNFGLLPRAYQVQHPMRGEAKYEFILTNPSTKAQIIRLQFRHPKSPWKTIEKSKIASGGCKLFQIDLAKEEVGFVRFVSRLYLARPVVIRQNQESFDIFHG